MLICIIVFIDSIITSTIDPNRITTIDETSSSFISITSMLNGPLIRCSLRFTQSNLTTSSLMPLAYILIGLDISHRGPQSRFLSLLLIIHYPVKPLLCTLIELQEKPNRKTPSFQLEEREGARDLAVCRQLGAALKAQGRLLMRS